MPRNYLDKRVEIYKKLVDNSWESTAIVITDAFDIDVDTGIGKKKDTFTYRISNANQRLFRKLYDGDGSTTVFTLNFSPPSSYLGTDKFQVYVDDVLKTNTTDYSVSGTTLTFVSAPADGTENVDVRFQVISSDDKCRIYLWKNMIWSSMTSAQKITAEAMEGTVTETHIDNDGIKNILTIDGVGFIESVFGALVFARTPANDKPHKVIISTIAQLNQYNPNRKIYGESIAEWYRVGGVTTTLSAQLAQAATSASLTDASDFPSVGSMYIDTEEISWTSKSGNTLSGLTRGLNGTSDATHNNGSNTYTGNATCRSDGTEFSDMQYDSSYKRAIELVEELSSDKYTTDGQYIYWVVFDSANSRYELHWKYKNPEIASGYTVIEGTNPLKIDGDKSVSDVVNAIVYNVGYDCNEVPHEFLNFDPTSQSSIGSKWRYISETSNISSELINSEFLIDTSKWNTTADGHRNENYPKDAEVSSWTFQFETRNSDGSLTGNSAVATTDNTFNDAIVAEAAWIGYFQTKKIIDLFGNPRYTITYTVEHSNSYALGSNYSHTIQSYGLNTKGLRLIGIKKSFWSTNLEFKEDESTAITTTLLA